MAWPKRPLGADTVACGAHELDKPFQTHVSPRDSPCPTVPPKSTGAEVALPSANPKNTRADGAGMALVCCVQSVPSHVHVSPRGVSTPATGGTFVMIAPPNSIMRFVAGSYAILAPNRAEGECADCCCVQLVPSQVHVSLSSTFALRPPNMMTTCRAAS